MKTKQRTLIILLVLMFLAGGVLLALEHYNTKAEEVASAAEDGTISLSAFDAEDLTSITYTYNGQTLTLNYADGAWTLAGDEEYHLDSTSCNTMVTALSALNAKRQLAAEEDEDYGFGAPLVTVTVTAAGQTNTFTFGAENSVTGDIYVQKEGDDAIYTVSASKASCFEMSKTDLFGAFNPAGLTSSDIEAVSYQYDLEPAIELIAVSEPVESTEDASGSDSGSESGASSQTEYETVWRLSGDTSTDLDQTKVSSILSALCSYVSAQYTNAELADYGLTEPMLSVRATASEQTVVLDYYSGTDGYYLMVEGDSSLYQVDASTIQAFVSQADELLATDETG